MGEDGGDTLDALQHKQGKEHLAEEAVRVQPV